MLRCSGRGEVNPLSVSRCVRHRQLRHVLVGQLPAFPPRRFPMLLQAGDPRGLKGQATNCLVLTWKPGHTQGSGHGKTLCLFCTILLKLLCLTQAAQHFALVSQGWYVGRRPSHADARACVRRKQSHRETELSLDWKPLFGCRLKIN